MLDTTPTTAPETTDWRADLRVGDVVLFRFPAAEDDGAPHPKPRPCLIADIDALAGEQFATVIYGTTSPGPANRGDEVHVRTPEGRACAGLARPTRFVGARRITVSLANAAFISCPYRGSPILGHLDPAAMERLHEIRARIHAFRDIAAERRSRRGRRRPAVRDVDFTVETRQRSRRLSVIEARP